MSCKVEYCRFAEFHTTKSHQCGRCGEFGHGQIECRHAEQKQELQQYFHEELPPDKWCEFDYCEYRKYHTTQSHYCKFCRELHHSINDCIYKDLTETESFLGNEYDLQIRFANYDNFYVVKYAGMGNSLTIRKKAGVIESLFMGSDMWGQYGPVSRINHRPLLDKFIEGITNRGSLEYFDPDNQSQRNQHKIVKCPMCRTENNMKDIITIKGLSETCKVCLVNEIEKCFPQCNHACVCGTCLESL